MWFLQLLIFSHFAAVNCVTHSKFILNFSPVKYVLLFSLCVFTKGKKFYSKLKVVSMESMLVRFARKALSYS